MRVSVKGLGARPLGAASTYKWLHWEVPSTSTRLRSVAPRTPTLARQLEDENAWLKRLVADLTLDKHMLAEALRRKS